MDSWPTKDPDSKLDYGINWLSWLDGDTISASTWIVPAGITKDPVLADDFTATTTRIWLTGGTAGTTYELTNRITTAAGRIQDHSVKVKVKDL